jgi:hypothetical protein
VPSSGTINSSVSPSLACEHFPTWQRRAIALDSTTFNPTAGEALVTDHHLFLRHHLVPLHYGGTAFAFHPRACQVILDSLYLYQQVKFDHEHHRVLFPLVNSQKVSCRGPVACISLSNLILCDGNINLFEKWRDIAQHPAYYVRRLSSLGLAPAFASNQTVGA